MSDDALEVLLDRLASGDLAAAEQVFLTYGPYLRKVVRRQLPARLRAKFDSVDVVQSVWADFVRNFRAAGWHFADAAHLRAFLVKVTRNRFIDRVRQHQTALKRERPLEESDGEGVAARQPRPSEVVEAGELWEQILELCPPAHRPVLLYKRQGLPMTEIVARTGLHEDSIRRILRTLARQFAARQGTSGPGLAPS